MSTNRFRTRFRLATFFLLVLLLAPGTVGQAQPRPQPPSATADNHAPLLHDRGPGVSTSMFGTYIRGGEWLVYPFFEHYRDHDFEYKPNELGAEGETDHRGRFRAREGLLLVAYGLTNDLAVEFEAAYIHASLTKASADTSNLPPTTSESGVGDVEGQIRWRWRRETASRPELFSYAEFVVPHHRNRPLTGTAGWEVKAGTGLIRGFRWGTLTARAALEYSSASSSHVDVGEYAVEYLKRLHPRWRVYLGLEGTQDEISAIAEVQWNLARHVFAKFNNGVGLTSKATDWAPEIGVVFSWPR
ncbi:MAG: hypothetical protein AB7I50_08665 [Vicinamibacterales bacterium]